MLAHDPARVASGPNLESAQGLERRCSREPPRVHCSIDMFASRTAWNLAQNRFSLALDEARRCGRELFDLTESNPTRVGLRYPPEILAALSRPASLEYRPDHMGLESAREAVA